MSLLFLVIIYIIYTTTSQTITANGDDIICSTSQSQCTVDCIDTNCNKIKIYSSSNKTIINCNSPLSCINTDLICIGNYNQCILSCTNIHSCTNSTLTCNDKSNNNAICRCEGIGCPPTEPALITNHIYDANEDKIADTETETQTEGDNNNYKMNESVLIMFFVGFFIVVLCCFCILIVALSFIGLYFSEKKKNNDSKYKISFGSSDGNREQIGPLKYEKSEATHRMSYFSHKNMSYDTCHKNMSYDTTISMYNNDDEKDDITEHHLNIPKQIINQQQQQLINQQQQQIINHQQQQIINQQQQQQQQQVINHQQQQIINQPPQQHIIDIEQLINEEKRDQHNKSVNVNLAEQLGNQFETENKMQMQEESRTQTEIQHEGILKNKQVSKSVSNRNHQKFDSEDLYITAQTTINDDEKDNEYENENKINDDDKKSIDDIGSDDECLPELDGNQFHTLDGHNRLNLSIMNHSDSGNYTLDGHNRNVINNNNNNNTNNNINDLKLQPDDIMVSVSNDNGLDDINADISAQLPFSPAVPVAAADTITKHPPKKLLLHPPTIKGDQRGNKHKNIEMYLGSEGNQSQTESLKKNEIETENDDEKVVKIDEEKEDQDHLCIVRLGNMNGRYHSYDEEDYKKTTNPLHDNMTGVERMPLMHGNTSNTETISTFTIKSNPGSLSRTTSLNSAAAVRVAFPTESSSTQFKANRTSYYNIINKQNKNITNYITHKNNNIKHTKKHTKKHRNYYSEQFYNFTPQLVQFEPQNNKSMEDMNKTPPNSNRTDLSISNITTVGTEKPLILNNTSTDNNLDVSHKAISSSMIVTLPISPHNMNINNNINNNMNGHRHNSYYSNITDELPPPPPHISLPDELPPPHILIPDENVKRSRPKSSRKKKKSSSSRSKSRSTSHRDSIGSGNTITTKKSKSRSSRSTTSSNNTYILSSSSQDSKKGSKRNSKKHRKRSSPKSPSINNTYRRNTTKSLKTIKTNTNTSTNHNPSQIVIKTKHKIRRNRHESVSSYSKNNNDDMDRDIHKYSNGNVTRNVKIKRSSKLMLKQSYDQNITIPIKTSKSVNVPKIDINLHANSLNPKWSQKRVMMTPPVDIHHIPNGSKRNRSKYENRGFGDLIPSQSMFVRNIIK